MKWRIILLTTVIVTAFIFLTALKSAQAKTDENWRVKLFFAQEKLTTLKAEIDSCWLMLPIDGKISHQEMLKLDKLVSEFEFQKRKFDKSLKPFGQKTEVVLNPVYREHCEIYSNLGNHYFSADGDDNKQTITNYWKNRSFKIVTVEPIKGANKIIYLAAGLLVLSIPVGLWLGQEGEGGGYGSP